MGESVNPKLNVLNYYTILFQDLEIAADFNIVVNTVDLLDRLKESSHAMVGITRNGLVIWVFNTNII
jgi:hypothetical protein